MNFSFQTHWSLLNANKHISLHNWSFIISNGTFEQFLKCLFEILPALSVIERCRVTLGKPILSDVNYRVIIRILEQESRSFIPNRCKKGKKAHKIGALPSIFSKLQRKTSFHQIALTPLTEFSTHWPFMTNNGKAKLCKRPWRQSNDYYNEKTEISFFHHICWLPLLLNPLVLPAATLSILPPEGSWKLITWNFNFS